MSNVDDEIADLGQHVLRTARVEGLRRRMNEFVDSHKGGPKREELRAGVDSMAELVDDGRNERI